MTASTHTQPQVLLFMIKCTVWAGTTVHTDDDMMRDKGMAFLSAGEWWRMAQFKRLKVELLEHIIYLCLHVSIHIIK